MSSPQTLRIVSTGVRYWTAQFLRMQLRFFRQHLKAAPAFVSAYLLRLQCQSAGSLKTQECIISGGCSCGPCGFNSFNSLKQPLAFFAFPVRHLAYDNTWGDCSFKFDLFLDVFINWCQICQSTTGLNRLSIQQSKTTRMITSSIFKFPTWVRKHLLVLRFSLYLNI